MDYEQPQPWEPLPEESPAARRAFRAFLELGPGRSLAAAYRAVQGEKEGETGQNRVTPKKTGTRRTTPSHWQAWVSDNAWYERAEAYDAHQAMIVEDALREEAREKAKAFGLKLEQQAQTLGQFVVGLEKIMLPQITRLLAAPEDLSARDLAYLLGKVTSAAQVWGDMEAAALGLPQMLAALRGMDAPR